MNTEEYTNAGRKHDCKDVQPFYGGQYGVTVCHNCGQPVDNNEEDIK